MSKLKEPLTIFWFRRDLRLHDNHGFYHSLRSKHPVLTVFIFDSNILNDLAEKKDARVSFIYQSVRTLQEELHRRGSSMLVLKDSPLNAFKKICSNYSVSAVYANHDFEPYAIDRDRTVKKYLQSKQILFVTFKDQVIFEKSEVVKHDGSPYTIFTPYAKAWKQKFDQHRVKAFASQNLLGNLVKSNPIPIPSLRDIGFHPTNVVIPSLRLNKGIIANYDRQRNFPFQGTTRIGVHLRFGTASIRKLAAIADSTNKTWLNELVWREFFMTIMYHFPRVVKHSFKPQYDRIQWRNNDGEFTRWCNGETGYPFVDAGMRELNATGFMHNRVRMIVASFLTKHLLIDWRWGEAYFSEKLLDFELSSNNGNWQWAAGCGCDAAPYFRIFNPATQLKKFDPDLAYVRTWLGNMESYHIKPIVEHVFARNRAIDAYKKALKGLT